MIFRHSKLSQRSEKKSYPSQKKLLDKIFSLYIRLRGADKEINQCFTCGHYFHYKRLQAGHYIPRNHLSVRWDERNVQPQCVGCNIYGNGKPQIYAIRLKEKYGDGILEELNLKKNLAPEINKYTIEIYIEEFKQRLEKLQNESKRERYDTENTLL